MSFANLFNSIFGDADGAVVDVSPTNIDEVCDQIAQNTLDEGFDAIMSMVGNAGQEAIIYNSQDTWWGNFDIISQGENPEYYTDHDEAVYIIVEYGYIILAEAAFECAVLRFAAALMDLDSI